MILFMWYMVKDNTFNNKTVVKVYAVASSVQEARGLLLGSSMIPSHAIRNLIEHHEPIAVKVPCAEVNISNNGKVSSVIIGERLGIL